jgi:biopolymer transport protein ExbD
MMDALITLIAFLMYTMSFLALTSLDSLVPLSSQESPPAKLPQKPLQLTLAVKEKEVEISSPFDLIATTKIPHLEENKPDLTAIHEALIKVKQQFANENKIVLMPHPSANYDELVGIMDAVRILEPSDPPIFTKNAQGTDEAVKVLFSDLTFGNLLGLD